MLLTRRAAHMRTFPGVWVPPGGGVEAADAGLAHAALRELAEETGVAVRPEEEGGPEASILGLWGSETESPFPSTIKLKVILNESSSNLVVDS